MDYTLSTLARNLLKQERSELSPTDIPGRCRLLPPCCAVPGAGGWAHKHSALHHWFHLKMPAPPTSPCAAKYESAAKLLQLVRHAESDAWLALGLAFYLSVLPLTRQLVSRVVDLWLRCLRASPLACGTSRERKVFFHICCFPPVISD